MKTEILEMIMFGGAYLAGSILFSPLIIVLLVVAAIWGNKQKTDKEALRIRLAALPPEQYERYMVSKKNDEKKKIIFSILRIIAFTILMLILMFIFLPGVE